ncbi:hypothetical protein L1277_002968 [Okibacterium sp. HSC-33S16]|uniref:hypothetical protein n=1 Tax=Okibacterium sp. HSC-33S16 TaxID=2910965 RepID=UPI00209CE57F|nr:hypothetical protein [Okibacterium sp. HSC-33S16]MCP2032855.1 hypothetical protein [Okibacterium sp. HSC-33S16]
MNRALYAVGAGTMVLALTGCTAAGPVASTSSASPTPRAATTESSAPLGRPGCDPASPVAPGAFPEIQGTGHDGATLYGLVMGTDPYPFAVSDDGIKVVWRFTGEGDELSATLTDPTGTSRQLDWGPEYHGGSTYDRPGQEWGTGFTFDVPGCWTLDLSRDESGTASVYFDVAP